MIRIAAITLASGSAIVIARSRPPKVYLERGKSEREREREIWIIRGEEG